jgi:hypothetical protein
LHALPPFCALTLLTLSDILRHFDPT